MNTKRYGVVQCFALCIVKEEAMVLMQTGEINYEGLLIIFFQRYKGMDQR